MLEPVGGADASAYPYRLVGSQRVQRANNDGTFTPVVNVTLQSVFYGVQFSFTILASTWDAGGAPEVEGQRTEWVDAVCGHEHVQGFYTQQDQGPDQVLYNFAHIVVGTDDGAVTDEAVVRMDHLGDAATVQKIDATWQRLVTAGAS